MLLLHIKTFLDYIKNYLKNVHNREIPIFVLPNYNEKEIWNYEPANKNPNKITIGWVGSTTHINDLKLVLPTIKRLLKEYPKLEFNLMGGIAHETAPDFFSGFEDEILDRVYITGGTTNFKEYPKVLSEQPFDIGIAPLTSDEFNRAKSHIKWMEYAVYGIPCVASRVYPYHEKILGQDTIIDGETGMLCDEKEWYKKLKKLIDNKELREKIGKKAQEYVLNELQYKDHQHLWSEALSSFAKNL